MLHLLVRSWWPRLARQPPSHLCQKLWRLFDNLPHHRALICNLPGELLAFLECTNEKMFGLLRSWPGWWKTSTKYGQSYSLLHLKKCLKKLLTFHYFGSTPVSKCVFAYPQNISSTAPKKKDKKVNLTTPKSRKHFLILLQLVKST